ncbi:MAG TPA: aminotransferase class V-fold PLP-dependent enzyme [Gaiellaceae bacterium]|nr:aminotransferase class V-fold PLP-dependent enzyme [Gaiellaceae bacterium]
MTTFDEARARFPVLREKAYLNAGTFGPLAQATLDATAAEQAREGAEGRSGAELFERMLERRERVREAIAAEIGAPAANVALTSSTTSGCNLVVAGLGLGPDDEVVTTDVEHFGIVGPLVAAGARIRIARVRERPAAEALDAIRAEVTPATRLVALSHVSWLTGQVLPIAELREATGLPVLVDGAQSAGAIPVDATRVDWYTVSAQKWLCGPDATGALYVRDPESLRVTAPSYWAQAGYDLLAPSFEPKPGAARFDAGTIPAATLAGLEAALAGRPDWRYEHARAVAERCRPRLAEAGFQVVTEPGQGTLVVFAVEGDPDLLVTHCHKEGVVVRALPHTRWIRASCGWWTSDEDVERLVAALG